MRTLLEELQSKLKNLIEENNNDIWTWQDCEKYQSILIILLFCYLGGQRRQVIAEINMDVNFYLFLTLKVFYSN